MAKQTATAGRGGREFRARELGVGDVIMYDGGQYVVLGILQDRGPQVFQGDPKTWMRIVAVDGRSLSVLKSVFFFLVECDAMVAVKQVMHVPSKVIDLRKASTIDGAAFFPAAPPPFGALVKDERPPEYVREDGTHTTTDDPDRAVWYSNCLYWTDDWNKPKRAGNIPVCPRCSSPGFIARFGRFWAAAEDYDKASPGYAEWMRCHKERCAASGEGPVGYNGSYVSGATQGTQEAGNATVTQDDHPAADSGAVGGA